MSAPWRHPALVVLVLAPLFGESLSAASPPLDVLAPWRLPLLAGLYGCGALLCREVSRRRGLGFGGLCLLGAAYGVWEEAVVDRFWFSRTFWDDSGVGAYSEVWHTNVLLAVHLTAFHCAVSVCASVLVVERLFPGHRDQAWAGRPGLVAAGVVLGLLVPVAYAPQTHPPVAVLVAAVALCASLVLVALRLPRRGPRTPRTPSRGLPVLVAVCTATHFVSVYALPATGLPWPVGVVVSVVPLAAGWALVRRVAPDPYGTDGLRVLIGILSPFAVLAAVVGLGGRLDLTAGAVLLVLLLRRLSRAGVATS